MHRIAQLSKFIARRRLTGPQITVGGGSLGPVADGSAAAVWIAGDGSEKLTREALSASWPKLTEGGVLAGANYFDGTFRGVTCGVRSAVDSFSLEKGLAVRLTLDVPPAWYAIKGERAPAARTLKIGLLTGYDAAQRELAAISSPNKAEYCRRHGYSFLERTDGFDPRRHPVWGKVKFLRELLPAYDWLFWSDADSLILRPSTPLELFLPDDRDPDPPDVVIGFEDFGLGVFHINAGQFFVRNSRWSRKFLDDWYAVDQFEDDALREQRALIHLIESRDLSSRVRLVPQRRFNSYPINYRDGDFLLHFPDIPMEARLRLMRRRARPNERC